MANAFPRVYRTFEDFERSELRKLDHLYGSVDDMMDELLAAEMDDEPHDREDGILFDDIAELEAEED